ncbi:hypothetical protein LINPERHAP1_LOCUS33369 [Linum perenne]
MEGSAADSTVPMASGAQPVAH